MPEVVIHDRAIHFEWLSEVPSQPALVVLNTMLGDTRTWKSRYRSLAKRLPIVCLDVTNRGLSTFTGRPATMQEQLEDIQVLVQSAGVRHPIWVGNSAGASLAYRAAATLQSSGLVLLAPLFSLGMELKVTLLRRVLLDTLSDATLEQFHNLCSALTYSAQYLDRHPSVVPLGLARLRALFTAESLRVACEQTFFPEADEVALLEQVTCPALIVRPEEELLMPPGTAKQVARLLPGCRLEEVPGGHRLLEEAPRQTFHLLASFVEAIGGNTGDHRGR